MPTVRQVYNAHTRLLGSAAPPGSAPEALQALRDRYPRVDEDTLRALLDDADNLPRDFPAAAERHATALVPIAADPALDHDAAQRVAACADWLRHAAALVRIGRGDD